MANVPVTGLTYNGKQLYYEDTGTVTPPVEPPVQPPTTVPEYVVPASVAGRPVIVNKMAWVNGAPRIIADLGNSKVWAIVFTPKNYVTCRFAGGDWIDNSAFRMFTVMRNKDSAVIVTGPPEGTISPAVLGVPGVPAPRTGRCQLEPGVTYTLSLWTKNVTAGASRMFMELYFQ